MIEKKLNILVTGSSGSVGLPLCDAFMKEGHWVTGLDRIHSKSGTFEKKYPQLWRFMECDLTEASHVKRVLEEAHSLRGPFYLVINNAGSIYSEPLVSIKEGRFSIHDFGAWDKTIASNLSAGFYVTAVCAEKMLSSARPGVIINISSICAAGNAGQSAYSAAKAGVNAMTASLSKELGASGIRIAAISPGFLDTTSTHTHLGEKKLEHVRHAVPLRKLGQPGDLLDAVRFILRNDYFHGKVLELDGGLTL